MFSYAQTFTYPTVKLADWNHQAITLVKESKEARPKRVSRVKRFRRLGKEDKKSMEKTLRIVKVQRMLQTYLKYEIYAYFHLLPQAWFSEKWVYLQQ